MIDSGPLFQTLLHFDRQLGSAIPHYGTAIYAILFAIVFCEIGIVPLFFLPGDPLLFITGAFCATGAIQIGVVIPLFITATIAGSALGYWSGQALGRQAMQGHWRWLNPSALNRTQAFFEAHGSRTFLVSPFIAVVRTFAPFIAGASRMRFSKFALFVTGGAVLWSLGLVVAGYFFGRVPLIRDNMSLIVLLGVAGGVGATVIGSLLRAFRSRPTTPHH
jgi:membrane-associated protein